MSNELVTPKVELPAISDFSAPMLKALTDALGVDRSVLPTDVQIENSWQILPKLLSSIPSDKREEGIMRMCVAVASGLFDSAINYAWNAAIIELREKVKRFGINLIPQFIGKEFDEKKLADLRDNELLKLCLRLNLVSETGYLMLDQCRDTRNNFSAAHPAVGALDEYEFINFLSRCNRYALSEEKNMSAIDIKEFMNSLKAGKFSNEQLGIWCERIEQTFVAQREAVMKMLHGIYCDPSKEEHIRVTSISICKQFVTKFTPGITSELINQHQTYIVKGEQGRLKASRDFFQKLGQLGLLSNAERHSIISTACKSLLNVHNAMDNFYNEQPFAERLADISIGHQVPESVQNEFVETVVTCSVGNEYGTAHSADTHYQRIIGEFSPREIEIMLSLPETDTVVGSRIKISSRCNKKFKSIVGLLQVSSVPTKTKSNYEKWAKD